MAQSCMAAPMGSNTQRSLSRSGCGLGVVLGNADREVRATAGREAGAACGCGATVRRCGRDARAAHEPERQDGEGGESAAPGDALRAKGKVWLNHAGICGEGEKRGEIGKRVEAVRNAGGLSARPPYLHQRAGGGENEERQSDGERERQEYGGDGMAGRAGGGQRARSPEHGSSRGDDKQRNMEERWGRRASQCA